LSSERFDTTAIEYTAWPFGEREYTSQEQRYPRQNVPQ
jgi:hypothetical protein